MNEAGKVIV